MEETVRGWDWTELSGEEHLCSTVILVILPGVFSISLQYWSPLHLGDELPCTFLQGFGSQQGISREDPTGGIQWCILVGWRGLVNISRAQNPDSGC